MAKLKVHADYPDQHLSVTHWVRIVKGFTEETAVSKRCPPKERPDISTWRWGRGSPRKDARIKLCIFWRDLHNMGAWVPVEELLDPKMLALLPEAGYADDLPYFENLTANRIKDLQAKPAMSKAVPFDTYDYVAVPSLWAFTKYFVPLYGDKFLLMPWSIPVEMFGATVEAPRPLDVMTYGMMSRWYPMRVLMHRALERYCQVSQVNAHSDIYYFRMPIYKGCHREQIKAGHGNKVVDHLHSRLAGVLAVSKMCFVDGSLLNIPLAKYFEPLAAGCLLMGPMPREGHLVGLRDGENMVVCDHKDIVEKVLYYISNPDERMKIARAGQSLVFQRHSIGARVTQVLSRVMHAEAGVPISQLNGPVDTWPTELPEGWRT
jgi:hypothetical protein